MIYNMKKNSRIIVLILFVIIVIAAVLGIFLYNKEHKVQTNKKETEELVEETANISDFKKKLQEAGLDITAEAENTECELIGASEGESYMISDSLIQVYKFDSTKSDELTVSNLKKAKEEGKVVMPSFNNYELKVVYHKGLILVNVEDHPDKDKIIEVFNNL